MHAIQTPGPALHVRHDGAAGGAAVVFSNSLGTDFRIWDDVLPLLPDGLRLVRYDKRGHGLSDCPAGPWSIGDHVADLAAVLDVLGVRECMIADLLGGFLREIRHV